jgi:hypothetical protein
MLLNFSDRKRTGVFNMIWPLASKLLLLLENGPFGQAKQQAEILLKYHSGI